MKAPLTRVPVIGTGVHDEVVSEDVNMSVATDSGAPLGANVIAATGSDVESGLSWLFGSGPSLSCSRLFYFEPRPVLVLKVPTQPVAGAPFPGRFQRTCDDYFSD